LRARTAAPAEDNDRTVNLDLTQGVRDEWQEHRENRVHGERSSAGIATGLLANGEVCNDSLRGAMSKVYVTKVDDTYRVAGTRISLDSLVYLYRDGISPESMVESYPAFTLEQVHGALAYYLANQKEIDEYLAQADAVAEIQHQESRRDNAELIAKLRRMRHANQIPG